MCSLDRYGVMRPTKRVAFPPGYSPPQEGKNNAVSCELNSLDQPLSSYSPSPYVTYRDRNDWRTVDKWIHWCEQRRKR